MLTDMPYKICNAITFNLTIYFMTNLNRHPGNFFFFALISFILTLTMSMLFRTIASVSRTLSQAMAPAAVLILAIVIYTGFALPVPNMRGWARWINYLDPVAYGFESLMINEFAGRNFTCLPTSFVPQGPDYADITPMEQVCSAVGAVPGSNIVQGTDYLISSYRYLPSHKWRNFGILWVFMLGLCFVYLFATEYITAKKSKGEVLLFRRGHIPAAYKHKKASDEEAGADAAPVVRIPTNYDASAMIKEQTAIFHWEDVSYDIKIKSETRRILDHVDGWVKPGTLTALMGVSGAGKTTLLDVLATRTTMGVISGGMLVDGRERDASFQRKTGYVQQQDLHLSTSTVREALNFSALLRQPAKTPHQEKLDYVEEVIKLLDMQEYADAVVGVPGEGMHLRE
jgi:ATP-binding cassette subfamily G (WHITE) protein 2 (PDR)